MNVIGFLVLLNHLLNKCEKMTANYFFALELRFWISCIMACSVKLHFSLSGEAVLSLGFSTLGLNGKLKLV